MEDQVKTTFVNELLTQLGYENIQITTKPTFYWDGSTIIDNGTASQRRWVGSHYFKYFKDGLRNIINENKNNKIVIAPMPDGRLIDQQFNTIRMYVDKDDEKKKTTIRGKLIETTIKDFIENNQLISLYHLQSNMQAFLDKYLYFETNVKNIDIINKHVAGDIYFCDDNGFNRVIDFTITGDSDNKDITWRLL